MSVGIMDPRHDEAGFEVDYDQRFILGAFEDRSCRANFFECAVWADDERFRPWFRWINCVDPAIGVSYTVVGGG